MTAHADAARHGPLLEAVLPDGIACQECYDHPPDVRLWPEEAEVIRAALGKRRREFTTVRHCARIALTRLGFAAGPILPGERGAPVWPVGVVGSLTHCAGFSGAALARATDVAALGIDAEPHGPLPEGVIQVIALPDEIDHLGTLADAFPDICWDRLLFSAKESVYKAWFPLARTWLGFEQVRIRFGIRDRSFAAELLVPGPGLDGRPVKGFHGRWVANEHTLVTAVLLSRSPSAGFPQPDAGPAGGTVHDRHPSRPSPPPLGL